MIREILGVRQGTPEWLDLRVQCACASDAAAMLGLSKRRSRTWLIHAYATGDSKEFSAWEQENLLDKGHGVEGRARALARGKFGTMFDPVVMTCDPGNGDPLMLASLDGLGMNVIEHLGEAELEIKLSNRKLAADVERGVVPDEFWPCLEHQLLVSGADTAIFWVQKEDSDEHVSLNYVSDPARRQAVLNGWHQFWIDVRRYKETPAPEVIPAAVATPTRGLPAISIEVRGGTVAVIDNLEAFGVELTAFVEGINKTPQDDQGFAEAEEAVKVLKRAATALRSEESRALAQTTTIEDMRRTVTQYVQLCDSTRLMLEKLVAEAKASKRLAILQGGEKALAKYLREIDIRLGHKYMPEMKGDFARAMHGKKTIKTLQDAVDTEVARMRAAADVIASRVATNLVLFRAEAAQHKELFPDLNQLLHKECEDFSSVVRMRIVAHEQQEEARLKAERERVQEEERARVHGIRAEIAAMRSDLGLDENVSMSFLCGRLYDLRRKIFSEDTFGEFLDEAMQAREASLAHLTRLHAAQTAAEERRIADLRGVAAVAQPTPVTSGTQEAFGFVVTGQARPQEKNSDADPHPSDAEIIKVVCDAFGVGREVVLIWMKNIVERSAAQQQEKAPS